MIYHNHFTISKPDSGPFKGYYLVVTPDGEIIEVFDDLPSAERWLADDEQPH